MAAPVITSATTSTATAGASFSYQITASGSPTSYAASGLPSGVSIDTTTGLITGYPVVSMAYAVTLSATNADGTGTAALTLTISSPSGAGGSWRAARLVEFQNLVATSQYGTSFEYLGKSYPCIADPNVIALQMNPQAYNMDIPARFDMYATEDDLATYNYAESGIGTEFDAGRKPRITFQGFTFEISSIQIDPKDATVILRANRKQ